MGLLKGQQFDEAISQAGGPQAPTQPLMRTLRLVRCVSFKLDPQLQSSWL